MTEPDPRVPRGSGSEPVGSDPEAEPSSSVRDYTGPGAWGAAALWLLGTLFVLSAAATVHSILATFGG